MDDSRQAHSLSMSLESSAHWGVKKDEPPLTIKQAAERENVSEKTIRRRLDALSALDPPGAHKIGGKWLIHAEALDALREHPERKTGTSTARRPKRASQKPSSKRLEA